MKEQIEAKINEIISHILNKPVEDITDHEYFILENRLSTIKAEEASERSRQNMMSTMSAMFIGDK